MNTGGLCNWNPKRKMTTADESNFWLREDQHDPRPKTPLTATCFTEDAVWAYVVSAKQVNLPVSNGIDFRFKEGRVYISASAFLVHDEAEIKKREPAFKQAVGELLVKWDENYADYEKKWSSNLEYLKNMPIETAPWSEVLTHLQRAFDIQREHWIDHFLLMYPVHASYVAFEEFCNQFAITEREIIHFLQGFENKMLETDREMWRFAKLAKEMNLESLFMAEGKELMSHLSEDGAGSEWLERFNTFLDKYGARTAAADFEYVNPSWREDPAPVLQTIRSYIIQGDYNFEENRKTLVEGREAAINAAIDRLPTEMDKQQFSQMLGACQKTYAFNEDHNFYIDQGTFVGMREVFLSLGRRLVSLDLLEKADDAIFMTRDELWNLIRDLAENEAATVIINRQPFRSLVVSRRDEWKKACETPKTPLFIGTPPPGMKDPIGMKVFGLTPKLFQPPSEETSTRLEGFAGSPGVAEGKARVITDARDFGLVKSGEILVCPYTSPTWTSLFSKIKGVVADTGGMLTHAAITAREYQIPAVVGTWEATTTIKNGQQIKVDGNAGIVDILG